MKKYKIIFNFSVYQKLENIFSYIPNLIQNTELYNEEI
jgi:hypothetical protein